ncbi:hypothetical protein SAMN04490244_10854 [Tranquillimonas rosea]|uniref:Uncharacterized protein n=1 Tax=Tranquillimonas rosea TaxID=641238 RepID=A0A1H9VSG3_9RHOB|nr:hypothetical protein [Tranquillimonas rosea]SES24491.1 hypothetical protein SAMN04490244_10854 [Tranquillimonas rosea]
MTRLSPLARVTLALLLAGAVVLGLSSGRRHAVDDGDLVARYAEAYVAAARDAGIRGVPADCVAHAGQGAVRLVIRCSPAGAGFRIEYRVDRAGRLLPRQDEAI